ncbi:NAD-dependent epimerase/dehydratase family protein [Marinospirillum perlucidum]|uniref:NAD-dependent epimerase/dehydratase family protein n=1 Tax=Marinospirillum perlucidum TaxID=1982602 RepID=UPI000DF37409|nr:NAD-dependent epimerase/dehydratase family protein [Marinospirillum perlucidum]
MKRALILGVNGNFGQALGKALQANGWQVQALLRESDPTPSWLNPENIHRGEAGSKADVDQAAQGAELLVYALNPPYHRWQALALPLLEKALQVAEKRHLQVVFPGNVYVLAPGLQPQDENSPFMPPTDKGQLRQQMEERLHQASCRGARILLVRAGDFIGPETRGSWLDQVASIDGKKVRLKLPHDRQHRHFWSYLPDLAANTVSLLEQPLASWSVFHDPGQLLNTACWEKACQQLNRPLEIKPFPWWALNLARPFSPLFREVLKMRYLWQQPLLLDGSKMQQQLGEQFQQTSLTEILQTCLPPQA